MRTLLPLLLCLLLLMGCGAQEPRILPETSETTPLSTEPLGLLDPANGAQELGDGLQRSCPLGASEAPVLIPWKEDLLIQQQGHLTRYTGAALVPGGSLALGEDIQVHVGEQGIWYFQESSAEMVLADGELREYRRVSLPEPAQTAVLSGDRNRIYYCTGSALRCLELNSGISRLLREMAYPEQRVTGLLLEDHLVELSIAEPGGGHSTLYVRTDTGQLAGQYEGMLTLTGSEDRYFGILSEGSPIFGSSQSEPQVLLPDEKNVPCFFLPDVQAAVTASASGILNRYDLESGLRSASVSLPEGYAVHSIVSSGDTVWILAQADAQWFLFRWDSTVSPTQDPRDYTRAHYTRREPDYEGLALCSLTAQELSAKYGIDILIYKEAVAVQPWDYTMTPEYRVGVLQRELELLDRRLGNYPEGFLEILAQRFSGIKICLVQELRGSAEAGSPEIADGIQFWEEHTAYLALSTLFDTEHTLYHELCHLIDTVVLDESIAYDQWDKLNPVDFSYDNDYITNQNRDGSLYLQGASRCFIDTYSMSYPKEDRARIMEYAMIPGNEGYFQSLAMQSKLLALCQGIREAFGLEQYPESFLWEQYLNTSLAWTE